MEVLSNKILYSFNIRDILELLTKLLSEDFS